METIITKKIDEISDQMIEDIKKIVRMPSVKDEKEEHAPFGKDIAVTLKETLYLVQQLGFHTEHLDHYIG